MIMSRSDSLLRHARKLSRRERRALRQAAAGLETVQTPELVTSSSA